MSQTAGTREEGDYEITYVSMNAGYQQLPVLDDVQICDGIGGRGERFAKKSLAWRSCTSVEASDRTVTRAGVY